MYLISPYLLAVFTVIEHVNVGTGIFSNVILLYLVVKFSRATLGTYKYLLMIFASYDIFLTAVHVTCNQQIVIVNITTFAAVSWSPIESRYITCLFCASFSIPFALILIHFLYRYWAIESPYRIALFTRVPFVLTLVFFTAVAYMTWFCLVFFGFTGDPEAESTKGASAEYFRRYNRTVTNAWVVAEHWKNGEFNLRPALILLCLDSFIFLLIILASILCYLTLTHISMAQAISDKTRKMHKKLLQTLVIQTILPIILVYTPYVLKLTLPFFSIPEYGLMSACTALNSAFPTFDALIIIIMIKDYRNGLKSIFGFIQNPSTVQSAANTSSS